MFKLLLPFIVFSLSLTSAIAQKASLTPIWESDTTITTPESVLLDSKSNILYISCINGAPNADNKKSFIAKMDLNGKVTRLKLTEGLNSTKGMGILGNKLYVTEMTNIVEIDIASGKILKRYPVVGAKFLNDIAVNAKKGIIYISDSRASKITTLINGKVSTYLDGASLKGTNGLLFENKKLLIGNGDGSLLSCDPGTKQLTTISKVSGGIDGIAALGNKKYIVTEWGGKIWYVHADGRSELMIDSSKEKINTADIAFDKKSNTLFVPTFFHNTVKAYSVNR